MKIIGVSLLLAAAAVLIARPEFASGKSRGKLTVFIMAGQSNMRGLGDPKGLSKELQQEQLDVLLFQKIVADNGLPAEKWIPLKPGTTFGPEVGFGAEIAKAYPKGTVGIIKVAIDGSGITQWIPSGYYKTMMDEVELARKGQDFKVAGFLWMQGETDTMNADLAKAYKANFAKLVDMLRKDFSNDKLPVVQGRIAKMLVKTSFPELDAVRKFQEENSKEIKNVSWVDTDDLENIGDNLHFNGKGQEELGRRFAKAILKMSKPPKEEKEDDNQ